MDETKIYTILLPDTNLIGTFVVVDERTKMLVYRKH